MIDHIRLLFLSFFIVIGLSSPATGESIQPANAEALVAEGVKAYDAEDYQRAKEIFLPLAIEGHAEAQYRVSTMFMSGQGFSQNYCFAAIWADKAARQNHPKAAIAMSFVYIGGWLVKTDYELAYRWAFHGERLGHPNGTFQRELAETYLTTEQLRKFRAEMDEWEATQQPPADIYPYLEDFSPTQKLLREKYMLGGC